MRVPGRTPLIVASACSFFVAALHVAIAIFGPDWYRYFGAPSLADRIEAGSVLLPTLLTLAVATVFAVWAFYALSGAGAVRRLPLLRVALFLIAAIYLLRGLQVVPEVIALVRGTVPLRFAVFSAFSGFAGMAYLLGTVRAGRARRAPVGHAA